MRHTHNPDNRADKNETIKAKINNTKHNTEIANQMMDNVDDDRVKENLSSKNDRRKEAIRHMRDELTEE